MKQIWGFILKQIEKLHLITQEIPGITNYELASEYLSAGGKCIQLRMKEASEDLIIDEAVKIKEICDQYDAKLIINDHPQIALETESAGVHLGKNDMSPAEARKILGDNFIIGGTANTISDIQNLVNQGVDYIGLGPFRFTTTKKKLSPVLGINGYKKIITDLKNLKINVPIVAIGGIELNDISELIPTKIHGIAVSSLIAKNVSVKNITEKITEKIIKELK